jgi:hypothetical protein
MDTEKRKFILLAIIIISAVVVGLIIYFLVFFSYGSKTKNEGPVAEQLPTAVRISNRPETTGQPQNQGATSTTSGTPVNLVQEDAAQVAKTFATRYGTYSNQGGSDQFDDLNLFVTQRMKEWLATKTKDLLTGLTSYETAYVVTSQAVSAKIIQMDEAAGKTVVMVGIRQTEQSGDAAPKVSNKNLKVELLKFGKRWKVDAAAWQ